MTNTTDRLRAYCDGVIRGAKTSREVVVASNVLDILNDSDNELNHNVFENLEELRSVNVPVNPRDQISGKR